MTIQQFIDFTKDLPRETLVVYHSYDKGCSLTPYDLEESWSNKDIGDNGVFVINPGEDYDGRKPKKTTT